MEKGKGEGLEETGKDKKLQCLLSINNTYHNAQEYHYGWNNWFR